MRLLIEETELPEHLPVELSGTIMRGADNTLFAWYGNGKDQVHIPCEIIVAPQNPVLSEEVMGQMLRTIRRRMRREGFGRIKESARRMNLEESIELSGTHKRALAIASLPFVGGFAKRMLARRYISA